MRVDILAGYGCEMRETMKKGLSLVELMIIAAIIGILAAIVIPNFQSHTTQAKEAVAKDSLRLLRSSIELYTAQHGGMPPGYQDDDPDTVPSSATFLSQTVLQRRYISKMPKNPFNNLDTMLVVGNSETLPEDATGEYGWVYQPATKTIRLDWPGSDKKGIRYYEY